MIKYSHDAACDGDSGRGPGCDQAGEDSVVGRLVQTEQAHPARQPDGHARPDPQAVGVEVHVHFTLAGEDHENLGNRKTYRKWRSYPLESRTSWVGTYPHGGGQAAEEQAEKGEELGEDERKLSPHLGSDNLVRLKNGRFVDGLVGNHFCFLFLFLPLQISSSLDSD